MAEQAQQTPEGRLYDAGFTRRLEWWVTPGDERVLSRDDAIEKLDSGEIKPGGPEISTLADLQPGYRELTPEAIDAMADSIFRPPPPPPPPWLEQLAELVAEKLKPAVRAEVRAALKADARRRAREAAA
jgi:hypothetical protein